MNGYYTGRLGKDPELRFSNAGTAWLTGSFAIESRVKRDGEWKSEAIWANLKVFGTTAEQVAAYASKGTRLIVCGQLQQDRYEKDGVEVERLVLVADEIGLDLRFGLDNG